MFTGALPLLQHELVKHQVRPLGLLTNILPLRVTNVLKSWALICLPAQNVGWPLCQHCPSLAAHRPSRNAFPSASAHADGPPMPATCSIRICRHKTLPKAFTVAETRHMSFTLLTLWGNGVTWDTSAAHTLHTECQQSSRVDSGKSIDLKLIIYVWERDANYPAFSWGWSMPQDFPVLISVWTEKNLFQSIQIWRKNETVKGNCPTNLKARREMKVFHASGGGHLIFCVHNVFHSPIHFTYELPCWKSLFSCTLNLSRIRHLSLELHFNIIVQIDICVLDYCTIVLPLDLKAFMPMCNFFSLAISWDCHVKEPS